MTDDRIAALEAGFAELARRLDELAKTRGATNTFGDAVHRYDQASTPGLTWLYTRPMRPVQRVFIHCTDENSSLRGKALVDAIRRYHVQEQGWSDIGYHYVIDLDAGLFIGRGIEIVPAAQRGHNTNTVAIVLQGKKVDDFHEGQFMVLRELCAQIRDAHDGMITFHGHKEVTPDKTCPVFDYRAVLGLDMYGHMTKQEV